MATSVNFPTYGFVNDTLALNEENWRRFFKPFIYDSVQSGLETTKGTSMTVNVSAGECRCGTVMGILDGTIVLDLANGNSSYDRIDSVVVQYSYSDPSTLSVCIVQGTPASTPVAPTMSKVFNTLWQMEIAQILVPAGATASTSVTITDKRVIYEAVTSLIKDTAGNGDTTHVWSADKSYDEITDLKSQINVLDNILDIRDLSVNRLDPTTCTSGSFNSDGDIISSTSNQVSDYCYIHDLEAIKFATFGELGGLVYRDTYYVLYDSQKNKVGTRYTGGSNAITVSENIYYVRLAIGNSNVSSFMVFSSSITPTAYIPYSEPSYDSWRIDNIEKQLPKTFTVAKTGVADFTTIKSAVEEAVKYKNSIVHVINGTYDLLEEWGNTYIQNYDHTDGINGIHLYNGITLYFEPNTKVTMLYTVSSDDPSYNVNIPQYFSPFSMHRPNGGLSDDVTIIGINIEASGTKYVFHDDSGSQVNPYIHKYLNCTVIFRGGNYNQALGGGFGKNSRIIIDGGYWASPSSSSTGVISFHNCSEANAKSEIYISNLYVDKYNNTGDASVRFGYYGQSTDMTMAYVYGCSLGVSPLLRAEDSSATTVNINIYDWNNTIRN